ncbi:hypothetical protein LHYA1_G002184 [Lachnellula hyalina]|uniref:Heterokaryon incompatibility domain-containing protein n=1 Tax=Lachnellula hyalina TaxID=1316788 RepID=A0A8H8U344_9HELO|nr:uncharacterized protein LHYA1_G002184 [Lachnellula hyalina]TVY28751.1 hypothetical protein LHYA1_G002184 [Lachnellula hyalina]
MSCARTWMRKCVENHDICSKVSSSTSGIRRPMRLLQIGMPEPEKLRLLTDEAQSYKNLKPDYLTLSHRWGSANPLELTSSTFSQLKQGIEIADLSKTFRHSIKVAQELNIDLIWIDSLCIFQDSAEDWAREAPLMQCVYGGAVCNISAIASEDSDTGCFFKRNPSQLKPYDIQTQWNDGSNGSCMLYYPDLRRDAIENAPLASRGWVFQERLLAPRILYLDDTQLFWECHGLKACEAYPDGMPFSDGSSKERDALAALKLGTIGSTISSPDKKQLQRLWQNSCFDDGYCAGLWRKYLPSQLLWRADIHTIGHLRRSIEYRAPSWSWASLDGPIIPGGFSDDGIIIKILECHVRDISGDSTGQIHSGVLRILGPLMTIELQPYARKWYRFRMLIDRRWTYGFILWLDTDDPICNGSYQIHCLPILSDADSDRPERSPLTKCLLLLPTGKWPGQFVRCGTLTLESGEMKDWKGFRNIRNHDWLQYESRDDEGNCVISII